MSILKKGAKPFENSRKSLGYLKNQMKKKKKGVEFSIEDSRKFLGLKVYEVLRFVKENDMAMDGYVGGRKFGNYEKKLPIKEAGLKILYKEWDLNSKKQGENRKAERLITSSNGKAYFTGDHYETFLEIKD